MIPSTLIIGRRGGSKVDPVTQCLYIDTDAKIKRVDWGTGIYAHPPHYIENFGLNHAFFSRDVIGKQKVNIIQAKFTDTQNFCNLLGDRLVLANKLQVIYYGEYYQDNGSMKMVHIWLHNNAFHFQLNGKIFTVPFHKTYMIISNLPSGNNPAKYQRLDLIYQNCAIDSYQDLDDSELYMALSKRVLSVNTSITDRFNTLLVETQAQILQLNTTNMVTQMEIVCVDDRFIFHPILIPIHSNISKSLFNTNQWKHTHINLEYDADDVRSLFRLYLSRELPDHHTLVRDGLILVYLDISRYIGFHFYTQYFEQIVNSLEFLRLQFPNDATVQQYITYLSHFTTKPLSKVYTQFYIQAHTVNFYVALTELGLSRNKLLESMQWNASPYLMEFLEMY